MAIMPLLEDLFQPRAFIQAFYPIELSPGYDKLLKCVLHSMDYLCGN